MNKFILLSLLLVLVFFASNAQPVFPPKSYVCYKAPVPLQIDGKMDEEGWQMAAWTDDFVDIEGTIKPAPRFHTRAKMLWDEKYLYVAAVIARPDDI